MTMTTEAWVDATATPAEAGHAITLDGGPCFHAVPGDTLLQAALRAGVGLAYECSSGGCGSCRMDLLSGEVSDLWPQAPGLTARDRQRGRRLACQTVPLGAVRVKTRLDEACVPLHPPRRFSATLRAVQRVTHDLREFTFQGPAQAEFMPGQYALLRLGTHGPQRAYSMSHLPNAQGIWQFIVRRVPGGAATGALFDRLQPGDTVTLDGPYGLAGLRPLARDIVCVAGGSGLAPMLSIARAAAPLLAAAGRRLHFFYGARTVADRAAQRLLADLPGFGERLLCHEMISHPQPGEAWAGATGWVHDALDAALGERLAEHELYFAGPPPMAQAVLDLAMLHRGVPFTQLHWDRFF